MPAAPAAHIPRPPRQPPRVRITARAPHPPHRAVDGTGRRREAGLVGRLRERERELAAVELLLARGGGVLVVEGRAGIGKTALAELARGATLAGGPGGSGR